MKVDNSKEQFLFDEYDADGLSEKWYTASGDGISEEPQNEQTM